jgi:hypothetical protein
VGEGPGSVFFCFGWRNLLVFTRHLNSNNGFEDFITVLGFEAGFEARSESLLKIQYSSGISKSRILVYNLSLVAGPMKPSDWSDYISLESPATKLVGSCSIATPLNPLYLCRNRCYNTNLLWQI